MEKKSFWYDKIEKWYDQGLWTADMVKTAAEKGKITQAEAAEIIAGGGKA